MCGEAEISARAGVAEKIEFVGYVEATKLAKIGGAKDPAKALEDHRQKKASGARERRSAEKVGYVANSSKSATEPPARPPRGNEAVHQYLKDALIHLAALPAWRPGD